MAETPSSRKLSPPDERARLLREIEASRRRLAGELDGLGQAVNVRDRLAASVRRHPGRWLGGGLLAGILLSRTLLPTRRSRRDRIADSSMATAAQRSLFLGLLGFAGKQILRLSEPALTRLARQEIDRWTRGRPVSPHHDQHPG
ncbi:MAG: hypothetical protein JNK37_04515 [Verrucomicrobiales bacterium]|nr:hypothetical protein [Verrucomicrobiales bacterium]